MLFVYILVQDNFKVVEPPKNEGIVVATRIEGSVEPTLICSVGWGKSYAALSWGKSYAPPLSLEIVIFFK